MASHSSATTRRETPQETQTSHVNETSYIPRTTRTATIINALKRRAQAVLNDLSLDAQSRGILRYALETNDPWLAKLVRCADAGEPMLEINFSRSASLRDLNDDAAEEDSTGDKIEALAEIICRDSNNAGMASAALLVLMGTLENATHPKALANIAKHVAFTRCGELNLNGMVDTQIAVLESELFAADAG